MGNSAKGVVAQLAQTYVLMSIDARIEGRFRVITMHQLYLIEPERTFDRQKRLFETLPRGYVVAGRKRVRRV
jgi:hypothetical protein